MRVLVCGGRYLNAAECWNWLEANAKDEIYFKLGVHSFKIDVLIHGGARGADEGAAEWGKSEHAQVLEFKANWKKYGNQAGPIRNGIMLRDGKPDIVIAFQGGAGTADMVRQASYAGIPIIDVEKTK